MALTSGFFNAVKQSDGTYDRVYNSDQISGMFEGLISDGVYESVGDGMIVRASSGLTITVGSGRMIVGGKWLKNDATFSLTLANAHLNLNRYSAIVARLDITNRTVTIVEKAGTAATNPSKPTITESTTVIEKCLAYVYVKAGATAITQSNIIDTRANSNLCGWVTGIIKQVNTSELFLQWQTAYEDFYAQMESWKNQQMTSFEDWLSTLTGELKVNTKIMKYHKVEQTPSNGIFKLDMSGYTYDPNDILFVNMNGVMLTETYDYLLDTSKNPVEIHTNAQNEESSNLLEITVLKSVIGTN